MKPLLLPDDPKEAAQWRKQRPLHSGVMMYFPDALLEVAYTSFIGNEQHNPGQPLHWDRSKSQDELDAAARHMLEHEDMDSDGTFHLAKVAWRALAALQKHIEKVARERSAQTVESVLAEAEQNPRAQQHRDLLDAQVRALLGGGAHLSLPQPGQRLSMPAGQSGAFFDEIAKLR